MKSTGSHWRRNTPQHPWPRTSDVQFHINTFDFDETETMKFKQNGVRVESQKGKKGTWVSVFPFLKPRCTLKLMPGHTLVSFGSRAHFPL